MLNRLCYKTSRCQTSLTPYFRFSINLLLSLYIKFRFRSSSFEGSKNKEPLMLKCSELAFKYQSVSYSKVIETSLLMGQHFVHPLFIKQSYDPFCGVYQKKNNWTRDRSIDTPRDFTNCLRYLIHILSPSLLKSFTPLDYHLRTTCITCAYY